MLWNCLLRCNVWSGAFAPVLTLYAYNIFIGDMFGNVQCNHKPMYDLSTYTNTPLRMNGTIFTVFVESSIFPEGDLDIYSVKKPSYPLDAVAYKIYDSSFGEYLECINNVLSESMICVIGNSELVHCSRRHIVSNISRILSFGVSTRPR